ncbi:MAG: hypothetical protein Q9222_001732 [Ikaeria aurantiellina]
MARKARHRISYVLRDQVQAHTHWVNDILLAQNNSALVSASSDVSVKVWRPYAQDRGLPTTIGLHSDYVKCLASPGPQADWVASGALDHKICLWDLHGAGERLCIDAGEDESNAKGSVYALSVRGSIMASGGPESIVRLWDPKSGKRITKLVGHTDNVRDILINRDGDTVMTASSDQTVKVWSIAAGRCLYTLNMHSDSVWSLFSDHPQLAVIYSSDRSGLVVKTDLRNSADWDDGLSLAVAQENDGVNKVIATGGHIWTATSSSSINRWRDIPSDGELQIPEQPLQPHRWSTSSRSGLSPIPSPPAVNGVSKPKIPFSCILRMPDSLANAGHRQRDSDAGTMYSRLSLWKMSEAIANQDLGPMLPFQELPSETIQGQHGLIKHIMLNDKRRVLTLDTAGEVLLWDLLKCVPIHNFGKRHLDEVLPEVNTIESVVNWCSVDTRTGRLTCILEETNCFDAEMYADELNLEGAIDLKDDQRINLGKWILRYLFASLIDEEITRDQTYRKELQAKHSRKGQRVPAPSSIPMPSSKPAQWPDFGAVDDALATPRGNGYSYSAVTPGLGIGVATPHPSLANNGTSGQSIPSSDQNPALEKTSSGQSQSRSSTEKSRDYFSTAPNNSTTVDQRAKPPSPGEDLSEASTQSPVDGEKEDKPKEGTSLFGKRFRMNFPKKLGRTSVEAKPAAVDEKAEESDISEEKEERIVEDNFMGTIQNMHYECEEHLHHYPQQPLPMGICPSSVNETPPLDPPPLTTIIIQEDRPDSGGVTDLYRGTVRSAGQDADLIEKTGPKWLGDLLLRNQTPFKEILKISFVLMPYQDQLPSIAGADGNSRLNANRMLRAKKICAYVAERIEPQSGPPDPNALKPEEYLELYCQDKLVSPNTTLATLRAYIWKSGGDVLLYYKSNGRRQELENRMTGRPVQDSTSNEGVPF